MRLFQVPDKTRVRFTSKLIRWVEHRYQRTVAEDVTWEGTTTDRYFYYKGERRRLIVNHTVDFWDEYGIWQRDTECEIINKSEDEQWDNHRNRNRGVLIDS